MIGQAKHDSNAVYYFSDPTTVGCFSLSLQILPIWYISTFLNISTKGKQDVLKQPEANTDWLYFSALSYYKRSVENNFLYLLLHFRIRIILLTRPDNLREISRNHACLQNHTNHNDARPTLFQLESSLPFSLFLFVWRLESTTTKSLLRHLQCRGSPLFKSRR